MKILLINVHSSRNAGDEALTRVTVQQLHKYFPHATITLLVDDPEGTTGDDGDVILGSFFTWATKVGKDGQPKWQAGRLVRLFAGTLLSIISFRLFRGGFYGFTPRELRALIQSYLEADLVVSKPGGFLYSSGSGVTLIVALFSMGLALLAGKPLYILPQSLGPLRRSWEKRLVKFILERTRILMVREPVSLRLISDWNIQHSRCMLVPDLAFAFAGAEAETAIEWLKRQGIDPAAARPLLGMIAINWGAENQGFGLQAQYEEALTTAARGFIEQQKGTVLLLPQVTGPSASQDDRVPARRIAKRLDGFSKAVLQINETLPPSLLRSIYGQMDIFIGTRMHSNIFALSEGVPVIAIGYQHKTRGILEMLGLERWTVDIQNVDGERLDDKLQRLWQKREAVRSHLDMCIPEIVLQAGQAARLLADDFFENNGTD